MAKTIYWVIYQPVSRYDGRVKRRRFDTESEARHMAKRFEVKAFRVTEEEMT